jgi:hypothetical protein
MSYFLELFDSNGFLLYLSIVHLVIALTVFVMMFITEDVVESDQADFQVMAQTPSLVAMEVIAEEALESQIDLEN